MSQAALSRGAGDAGWKGRSPELEDPLNRYVYHPLATRLAHALRPTGISPNAVSLMSGALVCAAAVWYCFGSWPLGILAGFACHLLWHVFDGADGDLARLTGKVSPLGEFIDGACDYVSHIVLYIALATVLDDAIGVWGWVLAVVSGGSRIAQSNHSETQRRTFLWRVYGVPWLKVTQAKHRNALTRRSPLLRLSERVTPAYLALAAWMMPGSGRLDALVAASAGDPERLAGIRQRIRRASQTSLVLQKVLGANPRTIILGLSMLAGSPLWFFLYETVLLNGILILSVRHHNAIERRLLTQLA